MRKSYIKWLNVVFFLTATIFLALNLLFYRTYLNDVSAEGTYQLGVDEKNNIDVFKKTKQSVVYVTNTQLRQDIFSLDVFEVPEGSGTGFIWNDQGIIVTNYHVIKNASRISVRFSDLSEAQAKVIGLAPESDVALIQVDIPVEKSKPIVIGSSANLEVGNKVLAIGNPFGFDQTLTTGIVSALGRDIKSPTGRTIDGVIQTDAAINPGNSGGPLINSAGEVIGINTAIVSNSGSNAGIGFAIPIDRLKKIVPQLIKYGKVIQPSLGIRIISDNIANAYDINGVIVSDVIEGKGAHKAGIIGISQDKNRNIYLGDVIIEANKQPVKNSDDLYVILNKFEIGQTIEIKTRRANKTLNFKVVLSTLD